MSPRPERRADLPEQLSSAVRTVERQVQSRLHRLGYGDIRTGHLALLLNLDRGGGRGSELARRAGMTKQSMGDLVRDLEGLDYLERRRDPRDGRALLILPTGRGLMLIAHARQAVAEVETETALRLGPRRYTELRRALAELANGEGSPETPGAVLRPTRPGGG